MKGKGNLRGKRKWAVAALVLLPLVVAALKGLVLSPHHPLQEGLSLTNVPSEMQGRVRYLLFVPLGAVLVVFCRLTLGIRVLGPFRSILLAVAFQVSGILPGLVFLAVVTATITLIRPLLKGIRLPYFGRVSVILSAVAAIMVMAVVASECLHLEALRRLAYFPVVVLCLTGEGFARTLYKEGHVSAAWRGGMTALLAVLITLISAIPGFESVLIRFPELLILGIGLIIIIAEYFDLRLLNHWNPVPAKSHSKKAVGKPRRTKSSGRSKSGKKPRKQRKTRIPSEEPVGAGNPLYP